MVRCATFRMSLNCFLTFALPRYNQAPEACKRFAHGYVEHGLNKLDETGTWTCTPPVLDRHHLLSDEHAPAWCPLSSLFSFL